MSFDGLKSLWHPTFNPGRGRGKEDYVIIQDEVDTVEKYFESVESWDAEFYKVSGFYSQGLPMIGEESFLWSGLLAKSELRQLLDELYEHAL
jgi:hypothetical protein